MATHDATAFQAELDIGKANFHTMTCAEVSLLFEPVETVTPENKEENIESLVAKIEHGKENEHFRLSSHLRNAGLSPITV